MKAIGGGFIALGYALFVLLGLAGFWVCLLIIFEAAGAVGLVAAFFLGPVTFTIAPLYAGFAWHNWGPAVLIYGGAFPGAAMIAFGGWLRSRTDVISKSGDPAAELLAIRPLAEDKDEGPPRPTLEQELAATRARRPSL